METALYLPVKRFLEKLGFTVKGEVGGCDLVALSGDDPPIVVIGELKLAFNLELILQAVDRAGAADEVWLAAKLSARARARERCAYRNLCRRLGFGMLRSPHRRCRGDRPAGDGSPRRNPKSGRGWSPSIRSARAIRRWAARRARDHDAYRQQALACASALSGGATCEGFAGRHSRRRKDPAHNVYGWFDRASGIYLLTDAGHAR